MAGLGFAKAAMLTSNEATKGDGPFLRRSSRQKTGLSEPIGTNGTNGRAQSNGLLRDRCDLTSRITLIALPV